MRFNYITLTLTAAVLMSAFVNAAPARPDDRIQDASTVSGVEEVQSSQGKGGKDDRIQDVSTVSEFDKAHSSQGKGRKGDTDALADSKTIANNFHRRDGPTADFADGPEIDVEASRSDTDPLPEKKEGEYPGPGSGNDDGKLRGV